jgi:hypothetical protein
MTASEGSIKPVKQQTRRHCEEPAEKLRSSFAQERRSNPEISGKGWIASLRSQ